LARQLLDPQLMVSAQGLIVGGFGSGYREFRLGVCGPSRLCHQRNLQCSDIVWKRVKARIDVNTDRRILAPPARATASRLLLHLGSCRTNGDACCDRPPLQVAIFLPFKTTLTSTATASSSWSSIVRSGFRRNDNVFLALTTRYAPSCRKTEPRKIIRERLDPGAQVLR
jgi:hypothetical protein